MGRYIFQEPLCEAFHLPHLIDPLWQKFQALFLTYNHRQGKDRDFAEILNRMRTGEQTEEDCNVLNQRVRVDGDKDLPEDALFIAGTNDIVNKINLNRLENMEAELHRLVAFVTRAGKQLTKPPRRNKDGSIYNTPLQFQLDLKVGARVMLTYNVDVLDSLSNGALGEVIGFEKKDGKIQTVLVRFDNPKVGKERRKKNSALLQRKYPNNDVTSVEKMEFRFNMSKNPTSQNDFMVAVQIPLKLAFACTAHKIQGSTVLDPKKVIVDLLSVKEPAQGYVMGSRVQRLDQLFILNEFPTEKIYPSPAAIEELNHLQNKALNNMEDQRINSNIIISLNIRSLVKHHSALCNDFQMKAKVIALQETWCPVGQNPELLQMPGYNLHLVNSGHGKGIATYFSAEFQQVEEVNREHYQMSKITSTEYDVVNVYCSKGANKVAF